MSEMNNLQLIQQIDLKQQTQRDLNLTFVREEGMIYRTKGKEEWSRNIVVGAKLIKECLANDQIETRATECEHGSRVLKMENDIMGERLKGLFEAISAGSSNKGIEDPYFVEMDVVKAMG
jgi:hypothetical protein